MIKHLVKDYFKHTLRSGVTFEKFLNQLRLFEKYSQIQLKELQNAKLRELIYLAYENVPYYRKLFREFRLTPADISNVDDLSKLPIIDKSVIRQHFREFRNVKYHNFVYKGFTSGTTGTPAVFLRDLNSINYENACARLQQKWMGFSLKDRRVWLRGDRICPPDQGNPPFWRFNRFTNTLIMSSYHLSDKILPSYVNKIREFEPKLLQAYPSTAYILANFCKRFNISLKFSAIFTSSEMLLEYQKSEIETILGCKIYDWYGNAERVAAIAQCEYGIYHEMPSYSIVEYLPIDNNEFEVIGTTLNNYVMPLIRYRTGDIVRLSEGNSCRCGRNFRIIDSIIGRNDDLVVLPDGRKIGGLLCQVFKNTPFIQEAQIIQHSLFSIEVKVVALKSIPNNFKAILIDKIAQYISLRDVKVTISLVDNIGHKPGEKFKFVKSFLKST